MFTSEKRGNDETGDGTKDNPFKTILQAMRSSGKEPFPKIWSDCKDEKSNDLYEVAAKSQLKKVQKFWQRECQKNVEKSKKEEDDAQKREQNIEEAKKIVIKEDPSWAPAKQIKTIEGEGNRGIRVKLFGWIHRLRRQGKGLMFATLRDGYGFLQCVFNDQLCQTYEALMLSTESSVQLFGTLTLVPEGKTAPGGHELMVDYWELIGLAPPGGADSILNEEAHPDVQLDNRHIMIRGENTSKILKMRSVVTQAFRSHYFDRA